MHSTMISTSQSGAAFLISSMKQSHAGTYRKNLFHADSRAQNLSKTRPAASTFWLGTPKLSGSDSLSKGKPSPRLTSPKLGKGCATQHPRVATAAAETRSIAAAVAAAASAVAANANFRPAEKNGQTELLSSRAVSSMQFPSHNEVHYRGTRSRGAARSPEPMKSPDRCQPFTSKPSRTQHRQQSLQPLFSSPDVSASKILDSSRVHWQTRSGTDPRHRQQQPRQQQLRQQLLSQQRHRLQAQSEEGVIAQREQENKCSEPTRLSSMGHSVNEKCSPIDINDKSRKLPVRSESQALPRAQNPVLLGHPLSHAETKHSLLGAKPKSTCEKFPEDVFQAMEKLGKAARHRGQHILVQDSAGRKRLARFDCTA